MLTSVRLPEEIEKQLALLSEMTGKKKSTFIIEALRNYIEELQDYYTAAERFRNYDETESISLDDMMKLYDLED